MDERAPDRPRPSGAEPPPQAAEERRALELALRLRPLPLPWRPPPDDA